jgi:hypothetical protein
MEHTRDDLLPFNPRSAWLGVVLRMTCLVDSLSDSSVGCAIEAITCTGDVGPPSWGEARRLAATLRATIAIGGQPGDSDDRGRQHGAFVAIAPASSHGTRLGTATSRWCAIRGARLVLPSAGTIIR